MQDPVVDDPMGLGTDLNTMSPAQEADVLEQLAGLVESASSSKELSVNQPLNNITIFKFNRASFENCGEDLECEICLKEFQED